MKNTNQSQRRVVLLVSGLAGLASFAFTANVSAAGGDVMVQRTIEGHVCHGANYYNGEQITDYASLQPFLSEEEFAYWNTFLLPEVGVINNDPEATNALSVQADTPLHSLMAAFILPGQEPFALHPESINVPLNNPYLRDDSLDATRKQLPLQSEMPSKLMPGTRNDMYAKPWTLRRWNRVNGSVELGCYDDNSGYVRVAARQLLPGIPYTVWSIFSTDKDEYQGFGIPLVAAGIGGAPFQLAADRLGRATFERELGYCPLEIEDPMMYIALLAHFDNELYGTAPFDATAPFGTGYYADHLCFPTGDHLLDEAGNPLVP